jgi:homoserine kinase
VRISVPASSANLGPGFDTLGMALDLEFFLSTAPGRKLLEAEPNHPASLAFAAAGGLGRLWWRSPIPPGRGLGFSGAARVAGALAGFLQQGVDIEEARPQALGVACGLEGHPDNAAASMLGGIVVACDGRVLPIRTPLALEVVVWYPTSGTSTDRARAALPDTVPFADAVFNVGRTALLVAALANGSKQDLAQAMEDRLHQDARLELAPASRRALDALRQTGALAAWLSGSGPTVAAFFDRGEGARVVGFLPPDGTAKVVPIDTRGARLL